MEAEQGRVEVVEGKKKAMSLVGIGRGIGGFVKVDIFGIFIEIGFLRDRGLRSIESSRAKTNLDGSYK